MKKNKSDEGGERRLLFLGQGDQKKMWPQREGAGCPVAGEEKKIQGEGRLCS